MGAVVLAVALAGASVASFAYAATTGSVKIAVAVQGGTAKPSDFTLTIQKKNSIRTSRISAQGGTITFSVEPGTYVISKSGPSRYTSVWSGACNAAGEVVITANTQVNCTLTNVYGSTSTGTTGTVRSILDRALGR